MGKFIDLTGQRFGRLVVKSFYGKSKSRCSLWLCLCDCGQIKTVESRQLLSKKTKSCGCFQKERAKEANVGRKRSFALPVGQASRNALFTNYKRSAKKRGLSFGITVETFTALASSNCFYCDKPAQQLYNQPRHNGGYVYNGIDRIDSSKGYTEDNCVPCCKTCNVAKSTMSQEEFKDWISRVYRHYVQE